MVGIIALKLERYGQGENPLREGDNIVTFDSAEGRWRWPWGCEVIPFKRD